MESVVGEFVLVIIDKVVFAGFAEVHIRQNTIIRFKQTVGRTLLKLSHEINNVVTLTLE